MDKLSFKQSHVVLYSLLEITHTIVLKVRQNVGGATYRKDLRYQSRKCCPDRNQKEFLINPPILSHKRMKI